MTHYTLWLFTCRIELIRSCSAQNKPSRKLKLDIDGLTWLARSEYKEKKGLHASWIEKWWRVILKKYVCFFIKLQERSWGLFKRVKRVNQLASQP